MDERTKQTEKSIAAKGCGQDILERVSVFGLFMFDQRCHYTDITTTASTTISPILQVCTFSLSLSLMHRKTKLFYLFPRLDSNISDMDVLHLACGMVFLNGFGVMTINQLFMNGYHNGMKVRVAMCSLMYRKVR